MMEPGHLLTGRSGASDTEAPILAGPLSEDFWEAFQAREVMERTLARLAALRRTDADLARLDAAVAQMQSAGNDIEAFNAGDFAFHLVLSNAAHNDYLAAQLAALHGWVRGMITLYTEMAFREGLTDVLVESHERLADAVGRGDAETAPLLMGEMMDRLREQAVTVASAYGASPRTAVGAGGARTS